MGQRSLCAPVRGAEGRFHFCWPTGRGGLLNMQVGWDRQKLGSPEPVRLFCFFHVESAGVRRVKGGISLWWRMMCIQFWWLVLSCELRWPWYQTKGPMVSQGYMKAGLHAWGGFGGLDLPSSGELRIPPSFDLTRAVAAWFLFVSWNKTSCSARDKRKFMVQLPFVSWLRVRPLTYQRTGGI